MLTIVSADRDLWANDGGRGCARKNSHEGGIGYPLGGTSRDISWNTVKHTPYKKQENSQQEKLKMYVYMYD